MKKLFCSVLFAVGFFVAAHAQLTVDGVNNTISDWEVYAKDATGNQVSPFTAIPGPFGPNSSGVNSTFPIGVKVTNLSNGCVVAGVISGIGSGTITGTASCAVYSVGYSAATPAIGNNWVTLSIN